MSSVEKLMVSVSFDAVSGPMMGQVVDEEEYTTKHTLALTTTSVCLLVHKHGFLHASYTHTHILIVHVMKFHMYVRWFSRKPAVQFYMVQRHKQDWEDNNIVIVEVTPADVFIFCLLIPLMLCVEITYSLYHHITLSSRLPPLPQTFKADSVKKDDECRFVYIVS